MTTDGGVIAVFSPVKEKLHILWQDESSCLTFLNFSGFAYSRNKSAIRNFNIASGSGGRSLAKNTFYLHFRIEFLKKGDSGEWFEVVVKVAGFPFASICTNLAPWGREIESFDFKLRQNSASRKSEHPSGPSSGRLFCRKSILIRK